MSPNKIRIIMIGLLIGGAFLFHNKPQPEKLLGGTTYTVCASGCDYSDLQTAINASVNGDTLDLKAGETYPGPIHLVNHACTPGTYTTVETGSWTGPATGTRVTTANSASMAIIEATGSNNDSIVVDQNADCWKIKRLWVKPTTGVLKDGANIAIGTDTETVAANQPDAIIVEQCLISADASVDTKRGIAANSQTLTVKDSYIYNFRKEGEEAQAISGWNGPGPFTITNNYLEATTQSVLFGGSDPGITGLLPVGITVQNNFMTKRDSWNEHDPSYGGVNYVIKNVFEIKKGYNILVEHNIFEKNWTGDQDGTGVLISICNQSGTDPTATIHDMIFRNNIIRHSGNVMTLAQGSCDHNPTVDGYNMTIYNNLAYDIGGTLYTPSAGGGAAFTTFQGFYDGVSVTHNTFGVAVPYRIMTFSWDAATKKITNFAMNNNIFSFGIYGLFGADTVASNSFDNAALARFTPTGTFMNNIISSGSLGNFVNYAPSTPTYSPSVATLYAQFTNASIGDYRLIAGSVYKVGGSSPPSDSADIGVNMCNGAFPDPAGDGTQTFCTTSSNAKNQFNTGRNKITNGRNKF